MNIKLKYAENLKKVLNIFQKKVRMRNWIDQMTINIEGSNPYMNNKTL